MKTKIPPPFVGLVVMVMMWGINILVPSAQIAMPWVGLISPLLVAVALFVMISAGRLFGRVGTTVNPLDPSKTSDLVTSGIFAYTRNPMYLGLFLILIAWAIWLGNILNVLLLPAFVMYMTAFQIRPEEEALSEIFGDAYHAYRKKVRRWI